MKWSILGVLYTYYRIHHHHHHSHNRAQQHTEQLQKLQQLQLNATATNPQCYRVADMGTSSNQEMKMFDFCVFSSTF